MPASRAADTHESSAKPPRRSRRLDVALLVVILVGSGFAAHPLIEDLHSAAAAREVVTSMTSTLDQTQDPQRREVLAQAQAYNASLAPGKASPANRGMAGCNEGSSDILELGSAVADGCVRPYERQLVWEEQAALCWIDIPRIGVCEPVYHGTADEALAAGVGHLEWSSLPVGGSSSHCVLAAHSGMEDRSMFDELERLRSGDHFDLHCLGDCYRYEVCETQTVLPEEAQRSCAIKEGADLCTLVTCTPYGINSHRLLVRGRRVPFRPDAEKERRAQLSPVSSPRRWAPPLLLCCGMLALAGTHLIAVLAKRVRMRTYTTKGRCQR